jgi:hypothetical protein
VSLTDLAAEQVEDGIKRLGLCGVSIGGSVNGEELSDPKFHPFRTKAEELGALVFLLPRAFRILRNGSRATACRPTSSAIRLTPPLPFPI